MAIAYARSEIIHAETDSSAVRLSAYITREYRLDLSTGLGASFRHEAGDLIDTGIMLPAEAMGVYHSGEALWNAATAAEITVDRKTGQARFKKAAQVAQHIVIALPHECSNAEHRELTERFIAEQFIAHGVACEWAIHAPGNDGDNNWHAHLLVSTRTLGVDGFGKKCRAINPGFAYANGRGFVSEESGLHHLWAATQMAYFQERGLNIEVDPYGEHIGGKREHLGPNWHIPDSEMLARQAEILAREELLAKTAPEAVLAALTERRAIFTARDIERVLRKAGLVGIELQEARAAVLAHTEILVLSGKNGDEPNGYFTTRMVRDQEERAMADAERLAGQRRPVTPASIARAVASRTLDEEQHQALLHACGDAGFALIEGLAGAGKSYGMSAAREAHERSGYRVVGLAPTNTVAQDLRKKDGAGIRETATLHLALLKQENGREPPWDERTAILVDEAGMVDAAIMGRLLDRAAQAGAKVIMVGDDRQLASVSRGGLFTQLLERHGSAKIRTIRRQASDWQRQASRDFAEGRVDDGLEAYDRRGFIHWMSTTDSARNELVAAWSRAQAERPDVVRFVYASTNAEVDGLNRELHRIRVERGEIDDGLTFNTVRGEMQISVGDRVQFYGNDRKLGLFNGTFAVAESVDHNAITVRLDDGKRVTFDPSTFDKFGLGYAGTVYRGQGKTQLEVMALYDNPVGWNARAAYVGLTRHKAQVDLFVGRDMAAEIGMLGHQMSRSDEIGASIRFGVAKGVDELTRGPHGDVNAGVAEFVARFTEALPAAAYRVVLRHGARGVEKRWQWAAAELRKAAVSLARAVSAGATVFVRPDDRRYVAICGLSARQIDRMKVDGVEPAVVMREGDRCSAWINVGEAMSTSEADSLSRHLADRFGGEIEAEDGLLMPVGGTVELAEHRGGIAAKAWDLLAWGRRTSEPRKANRRSEPAGPRSF